MLGVFNSNVRFYKPGNGFLWHIDICILLIRIMNIYNSDTHENVYFVIWIDF